MEDQNQPKPEGQIMDVAPAPPAESDNPSENPIVPSVSADESPQTTENNASGNAAPTPAAPEQPAQDGKLPAPAMPTGHKAGGPIIAIVAAVVVALGLAAITVFAYMKTQQTDKPAPQQNTSANESTTAPAEEVDQAAKDVDEAINAADEADFNEAELTDESLGL